MTDGIWLMAIKVTNTVNLGDLKLTNKQTMVRVGGIGVTLIKRRTERGRDHRGAKFEGYSTASALMPISQAQQPGGSTSKMQKFYNDQQLWVRKSRNQSTAKWVWIENGYKQYRSIQGRTTSKVNLTFSGGMLRNFRPKRATKKSVLIGFTGEQARKAFFLNQDRVFMRITKKDEIAKLMRPMEDHIRKEIKK